MAHVLLKNKKTGGVWLCPEEAADGWKNLGWEPAPKNAVPTAEEVVSADLNSPGENS